jgi:hypothetical protein
MRVMIIIVISLILCLVFVGYNLRMLSFMIISTNIAGKKLKIYFFGKHIDIVKPNFCRGDFFIIILLLNLSN